MILYLHGHGSSAQTPKASLLPEMVCHTIDYDIHSCKEVETFYSKIIEEGDFEMLVGHSLGGYWALRMGNKYNIPTVLVNPAIAPTIVENYYYPPNTEEDAVNRGHRFLYVEMGDERLDAVEIVNYFEGTTSILEVPGGHHRIEFQDKLRDFINTCRNYIIIG
jgi:predicted esterase YcpF (UPF0227 family)